VVQKGSKGRRKRGKKVGGTGEMWGTLAGGNKNELEYATVKSPFVGHHCRELKGFTHPIRKSNTIHDSG